MYSTLISNGDEEVFIFNADEAAAYIQTERIPERDGSQAFVEPVAKTPAHVMGIPACYTDSFGNDFYVEQILTTSEYLRMSRRRHTMTTQRNIEM